MTHAKRPLAVAAAGVVLALSGAGSAWACDGTRGSSGGDYPGTYPGTTTTSSSSSSATTSRRARRNARRARAARS